jgi:phosphopantetheinyl transferase
MTCDCQKPVLDIVLTHAGSTAELAWHVNPCVALGISPNEIDNFIVDIEIIRDRLDDLAELAAFKKGGEPIALSAYAPGESCDAKSEPTI